MSGLESIPFLLADSIFTTGAGGAISGLTGAGALGAGLLGSKLIGKPKALAIQPPAVMPTRDSASIQEARRQKVASMQARSGRASTIFTGQDEKLGG